MADHHEFEVLASTALRAIRAAQDDGDAHGYVRKWLEQGAWEHRTHATKHLLDALGTDDAELRMHLSHALCRVAMALVMLNGGKID